MPDEISNSDDLIDSRDIIARIEELEGMVAVWEIDGSGNHTLNLGLSGDAEIRLFNEHAYIVLIDDETIMLDESESATPRTFHTLFDAKTFVEDYFEVDNDPNDLAELAALKALASEGEDYAEDWGHGATLIRQSYFVEYCQELVSDIGDMPKEIPHYIAIDWEKTAENLKVDYTEVDFGGVTYLVR